ncbi:MAG: transposase [candidate division WOR-3 bacterium]|nr:transposase [candidate division WOR-3 bacterium]
MRSRRLTFKGAYHHIMNRGFDKMPIFAGWNDKAMFIEMMKASLKIYKMRIFAFCIMDNHFHIVMQNNNERMGDFFRNLLGRYGLQYNKKQNRDGYVYQGRYKSTLIQDDNYLRMSVIYTLLNPERKDIVINPYDYQWSSINLMYSDPISIVDTEFIESLFNGRKDFNEHLNYWSRNKKLDIHHTKQGDVLGKRYFIYKAMHLYNRRHHEAGKKYNMRKKDRLKKCTYQEICLLYRKKYGININKCSFITVREKNVRLKLLIDLRELCGMSYRDIIMKPAFRNLKYSSLGSLYYYAKNMD